MNRTSINFIKLLFIGAVAAMMVVTWLSREGPLVYTIIGSAAVYMGVLVATRTVGREELEVLKRLVRMKPMEEAVR